jgi:hypothetical protein
MNQSGTTESPSGAVWWARALDGGSAVFAVTTGAILAFAFRRDGLFAPFAHVGRRIARDIVLPVWGDVTIGLVVHLGESFALGALAAALYTPATRAPRLRAAALATAVWLLTTWLPWVAVLRADLAVGLSTSLRVGFTLLVIAALTFGPRYGTTASQLVTHRQHP